MKKKNTKRQLEGILVSLEARKLNFEAVRKYGLAIGCVTLSKLRNLLSSKLLNLVTVKRCSR